MSSRERWTVYPLLFLTLGIALKDKVTKEITTEHVTCRSVQVTDRQGKTQLTLDSIPAGGRVRVQSVDGPMWMLGTTGSLSGLMFVDDRGRVTPIAVRSVPSRGGESRPTQPAESEAEPGDTTPPQNSAAQRSESPPAEESKKQPLQP